VYVPLNADNLHLVKLLAVTVIGNAGVVHVTPSSVDTSTAVALAPNTILSIVASWGCNIYTTEFSSGKYISHSIKV
jgi:hypothetical protein